MNKQKRNKKKKRGTRGAAAPLLLIKNFMKAPKYSTLTISAKLDCVDIWDTGPPPLEIRNCLEFRNKHLQETQLVSENLIRLGMDYNLCLTYQNVLHQKCFISIVPLTSFSRNKLPQLL